MDLLMGWGPESAMKSRDMILTPVEAEKDGVKADASNSEPSCVEQESRRGSSAGWSVQDPVSAETLDMDRRLSPKRDPTFVGGAEKHTGAAAWPSGPSCVGRR